MRGYWFIGNAETGYYQFCKLLEMVNVERMRIVERYCGKETKEVDPHIWQEFYEDCFGAIKTDEAVGEGDRPRFLYYIDKDRFSVRSHPKDSLEAFFIKLFRPKFRLNYTEKLQAITDGKRRNRRIV